MTATPEVLKLCDGERDGLLRIYYIWWPAAMRVMVSDADKIEDIVSSLEIGSRYMYVL